MKRIYKYPLTGVWNKVLMPYGSEIITVRYQESQFGFGVMLYALVDPTADKVQKTFFVVPTGGEVGGNVRYVGTIENTFLEVLHIFEML